MKGTGFYDVGKHIKQMEIAELKEALKAHGGSYTWRDSDNDSPDYEAEDMPIVMANLEYGGPTDVCICKAWINEHGDVEIKAVDKEYDTDIDVSVDDIAVCHIHWMTQYMKDVNGIELTSKNHLFALENGKVRCLSNKGSVVGFAGCHTIHRNYVRVQRRDLCAPNLHPVDRPRPLRRYVGLVDCWNATARRYRDNF